MMSQFTLSKYYLFHGLYAFQKGDQEQGRLDFTQASLLTQMVVGEHYNYGLLLKYFGQQEAAAAEFRYFLTGFPRVFVAILAGIILGGLIAILLLVVRKKSRKDVIPFGPFLALGSLLALFRGHELINWYLSLFK